MCKCIFVTKIFKYIRHTLIHRLVCTHHTSIASHMDAPLLQLVQVIFLNLQPMGEYQICCARNSFGESSMDHQTPSALHAHHDLAGNVSDCGAQAMHTKGFSAPRRLEQVQWSL